MTRSRIGATPKVWHRNESTRTTLQRLRLRRRSRRMFLIGIRAQRPADQELEKADRYRADHVENEFSDRVAERAQGHSSCSATSSPQNEAQHRLDPRRPFTNAWLREYRVAAGVTGPTTATAGADRSVGHFAESPGRLDQRTEGGTSQAARQISGWRVGRRTAGGFAIM